MFTLIVAKALTSRTQSLQGIFLVTLGLTLDSLQLGAVHFLKFYQLICERIIHNNGD